MALFVHIFAAIVALNLVGQAALETDQSVVDLFREFNSLKRSYQTIQSDLATVKSKLLQSFSEPRPALLAVWTADTVTLRSSDIIKFNNVVTNIGNGYSPGKFQAPKQAFNFIVIISLQHRCHFPPKPVAMALLVQMFAAIIALNLVGRAALQTDQSVLDLFPEFNSLKMSYRTIKSELATVKSKLQSFSEPRPAFLAVWTAGTVALRSNDIIKFNHVVTNIGNGYSPGTGKFKAPKQGTYFFGGTVMSAPLIHYV